MLNSVHSTVSWANPNDWFEGCPAQGWNLTSLRTNVYSTPEYASLMPVLGEKIALNIHLRSEMSRPVRHVGLTS